MNTWKKKVSCEEYICKDNAFTRRYPDPVSYTQNFCNEFTELSIVNIQTNAFLGVVIDS